MVETIPGKPVQVKWVILPSLSLEWASLSNEKSLNLR